MVSVVPMYYYATVMIGTNRERLKTNERLLQNTITQSLGQDIEHRQRNLEIMMDNLASAIQVSSGGDLREQHVTAPELRALLEKFVSFFDAFLCVVPVVHSIIRTAKASALIYRHRSAGFK